MSPRAWKSVIISILVFWGCLFLIWRIAFAQAVIPYSRLGLTQDQLKACSEMFYRAPSLPAKRDLCSELKSLTEEFCG